MGVALDAQAAAFVYIYTRIPQIAEMTLSFHATPLSCGVRVECEDPAVLDFNRKIDICTTFKTVFTGLFE
jgi:hypothetical protein